MKLLYTLTETLAEAKQIARTLVDTKLAVCVNIFPGIESIYEWKSQITESSECALLIKVTDSNYEAALTKLEALHPYETPAILTLPPEAVNQKFLAYANAL